MRDPFKGFEFPTEEEINSATAKWNYTTAAKSRMANPATREKLSKSISKKQSDPKYLAHMSKQRLESMDKPVDDSGKTLREKLAEANRKSSVNPEHHANRTRANRRLKKDPNWQAAHKKGCWDAYGYKITTPYGEYPCMYEFDREHNLRRGTCSNFLKGLPHLFYKTEDGPGEPVYERIVYTEYGMFLSIPDAYKFAKEQGNVEANRLKQMDNWFMKMCVFNPDQYRLEFEEAKCWALEKNKPLGDTERKPRFNKSKLMQVKRIWQKRLTAQKNIYKTTKTNK